MDKMGGSSLFGQLVSVVSRKKFERIVAKHRGDHGSKGLRCWDQLVAMLFCQLAQARSLREISAGLTSCEGKLSHLGMKGAPKRSTLCYANAHRPWSIYEDLFYEVLDTCRLHAPGHKFRFKNKLMSLDATTIELCASMFDWAKFRATKGAVKLHVLLDHAGYLPVFAHITQGRRHELTVAQDLKLPKGSIVAMDRAYTDYQLFERWSEQGVYFVTRLKSNANVFVEKELAVPQTGNVLKDELVEFNIFHAGRKIIGTYRRVTVQVAGKKDPLVLLTNNLKLAAATIGAIYKERWQIELFFKAIKSNLKIKTFVGTSANAVHIQIWTALISILLVKLLQLRSRFNWAFSNLVALLRWNLFTYKPLWKWIDQPFLPPPELDHCEQLSLVLDGIPTHSRGS